MRKLTSHKVNGLNDLLEIEVLDEPGSGGACHLYNVVFNDWHGTNGAVLVKFQKGPVGEYGPNGISMEALLAIVEDRLIGFQSGEYANADNAAALDHVRGAMEALHRRTKERVARGVEGTSAK